MASITTIPKIRQRLMHFLCDLADQEILCCFDKYSSKHYISQRQNVLAHRCSYNGINMSDPKQQSSETSRMLNNLTQIGFGLGMLFPIISIIIDLTYNDYELTPGNMVLLYKNNPLHWIILSAPLVLGYTCYLLGKIISRRESFLHDVSAKERNQSKLIEEYISQLAKGDLTVQISDDFDNSSLSHVLTTFRDNLQREKIEAGRRRWANEGLTHFGDLLRSYANLEELSLAITSNLVKYLKCTQAGLFTAEKEGDDTMLVLKGCYAYERKKFLTKRIDLGTGLLGQCYLEKRTILLYDVPQGYVSITSGLGDAEPNCLVLCPLKTEDSVEGVIELAGFHKLEPHEIRFLEKVSENAAAVFKNLKTSEETRMLLEASQEHAEMMQSQEEEMRQNMEELSATQEEMLRKEKEFTNIIKTYKEKFGELERAAIE